MIDSIKAAIYTLMSDARIAKRTKLDYFKELKHIVDRCVSALEQNIK